MITLYHFGPFYSLPDPSPFCLKVDAYLRVAGLEFRSDPGVHHLRRAPKGKLPFIEDDGVIVPDSNFIIDHLKRKYGDRLDAGLDPAQRAVAHAFTRMLDENLYWCAVHTRWIDAGVWPVIRRSFFGAMPWPLRAIVPGIARARVRKTLRLQGLGRHSEAEILEIAKRDLAALSAYLGEETYFLGDKPTTLDVTAYAFLAEIIVPPIPCALADTARSFGNLVRFVDRFRENYYPA